MNENYLALYQKLMALERLLQKQQLHNKKKYGPLADPTVGQGRILVLLKEHEQLSLSELAALLKIRPQSLNELIKKLERGGYVKRRPSEKDRRVSVVSLTQKGIEEKQYMKDYEEMFEGFSEEDLDNLGIQIDHILANLEAELHEGPDRPPHAPRPEGEPMPPHPPIEGEPMPPHPPIEGEPMPPHPPVEGRPPMPPHPPVRGRHPLPPHPPVEGRPPMPPHPPVEARPPYPPYPPEAQRAYPPHPPVEARPPYPPEAQGAYPPQPPVEARPPYPPEAQGAYPPHPPVEARPPYPPYPPEAQGAYPPHPPVEARPPYPPYPPEAQGAYPPHPPVEGRPPVPPEAYPPVPGFGPADITPELIEAIARVIRESIERVLGEYLEIPVEEKEPKPEPKEPKPEEKEDLKPHDEKAAPEAPKKEEAEKDLKKEKPEK